MNIYTMIGRFKVLTDPYRRKRVLGASCGRICLRWNRKDERTQISLQEAVWAVSVALLPLVFSGVSQSPVQCILKGQETPQTLWVVSLMLSLTSSYSSDKLFFLVSILLFYAFSICDDLRISNHFSYTHVNPGLTHVNVCQKPLQYCKVISLQWIKKNATEGGKKKKPIFQN